MAAPTPEDIAAGVPAQVNVVQRVAAPGGGTYLVGSDGGIFAIGGAKFAGSVPGLQGDTLAGQHQFGANGLTLTPGGGYTETDSAGRQYAFGGAPAPNPLYQDPTFLAFMRTSGMSADQAVRDYENQVGLASRARDAALAELNDPFGTRATDRQSLAQGYENRGFSGSGQQAKAVTGYDTETANQGAQDQSAYTDAVNKSGQDFSNTIGGLAQKATEQGINTGQDQTWQKFLQGEAQKYPDMADKIMGSGTAPGGTSSGGA